MLDMDTRSYSIEQVRTTTVESMKEAIVAELSNELKDTEAERVIIDMIEHCQKNLSEHGLREQFRNIFPRHHSSAQKFKRNGVVLERHLRRFLEKTIDLFPSDFLGTKNKCSLLDAICSEVISWKPMMTLNISMPYFTVLDCAPCRALRSRGIVPTQPISIIQRRLLKNIVHFLTNFLLKNLM